MWAAQVAKGGVFVDVGANIGAIAIPVAGTNIRVIAIEAHPELCALLAQSAANNNLSGLRVIHAAAGECERMSDFPTPPLAGSGRRNFGEVGFGMTGVPTSSVNMLTLDQIAPSETRAVKIDVEGYEVEVLAGGPNTLAVTRPQWMVEANADTDRTRSLIKTFLSHDYRLWWFYAPFVTPNAARERYREKMYGDVNILAVPAEKGQPSGFREITPSSAWPSRINDFPYLREFGYS